MRADGCGRMAACRRRRRRGHATRGREEGQHHGRRERLACKERAGDLSCSTHPLPGWKVAPPSTPQQASPGRASTVYLPGRHASTLPQRACHDTRSATFCDRSGMHAPEAHPNCCTSHGRPMPAGAAAPARPASHGPPAPGAPRPAARAPAPAPRAPWWPTARGRRSEPTRRTERPQTAARAACPQCCPRPKQLLQRSHRLGTHCHARRQQAGCWQRRRLCWRSRSLPLPSRGSRGLVLACSMARRSG